MRVLTFNSHQPYLHLLSTSLPWTFGAIIPRLPNGRSRNWDNRIRPLPQNVRLFSSLQAALDESPWDWVLTHNVHDLIEVGHIALPKVFLVHGTLSGRMRQERSRIDRDQYIRNLTVLLRRFDCRVVHISHLKESDWGIEGQVIRSAVDLRCYGGYSGDTRGLLQVSNHLVERGETLGFKAHQTVCLDLPNEVIGKNKSLQNSRVAANWEDLKRQYRKYRVYLYTAVYPHEDGFNLSLLEAMATGMPVATMCHPTSPIEDGVEGIVGSTAPALREKVCSLLDHPQRALLMGKAAREKVAREFPLSQFQSSWQSLAADLD